MLGPFWALAAPSFSAKSSAAGIAGISSVVNLGGFFGPFLMGLIKSSGYGLNGGILSLAGVVVVSGVLVLLIPVWEITVVRDIVNTGETNDTKS